MSSLNIPLTKRWTVDDISLSNNDFMVLIMYLVIRLETPRMFYFSTSFFNTGLIYPKVSHLTQSIIESSS